MAMNRYARLRSLIKKTDNLLAKSPELSDIRTWHSDCLRGLREVYEDNSSEVNEWRSVLPSLDWGMVYQGKWLSESFFSSDEFLEDEEFFQQDYNRYRAVCAGRLIDMRDMLLDYLSTPSIDRPNSIVEHEQRLLDRSFPDIGFIDNFDLREFCWQALNSAKMCNRHGLHLPAVALVGSALEAMLLSMAEQRQEIREEVFTRLSIRPKSKANWNLGLLLTLSKEAGWVTENGGYKLADSLRDYRNLIHPAKYIADNVSLATPDFNASWAAVQKVADEIKQWLQKDIASLGD